VIGYFRNLRKKLDLRQMEVNEMSKSIISQLISFEKWKTSDVTIDESNKVLTIYLEPDKRYKARCSVCGKVVNSYHSSREIEIRDLDWSEYKIVLKVTYRRLRCSYCGKITSEEMDFALPGHRVTKRLGKWISRLAEENTAKTTGKLVGLSDSTIKRIDKTWLSKHLPPPNYDDIRLLAVDEFSIRKGHNYVTLVIDLENNDVLYLAEGRDQSTLANFYKELSHAQLLNIQAVAMDMWKAYIKATEANAPYALIVFDKFHIVAAFSRVINVVRNRLFREAKTDEDKELLKGTKYLLLRNRENLYPSQKQKLQKLINANEGINTVYTLNEQLKNIWNACSISEAFFAILNWWRLASASGIVELITFGKQILRHLWRILNYYTYRISTAKIEGMINKIKLIKRRAYGYTDTEYFFLKIRQAFCTN